jgi:hypothetical protein
MAVRSAFRNNGDAVMAREKFDSLIVERIRSCADSFPDIGMLVFSFLLTCRGIYMKRNCHRWILQRQSQGFDIGQPDIRICNKL